MDDLFGHNRKPHMVRTAEIEAQLYRTPDEANSYRGIKDMDFGIESEVAVIESRGFLKSQPITLGTMRDFVPNPDGYFMEGAYQMLNDTRGINIAEVQRLALLNDGQYAALVCKLPENASSVKIESITSYASMLNSLRTLTDTVLPLAIEVYRRIFTEDYEWCHQKNDFLEAELMMITQIYEINGLRTNVAPHFYGNQEPTNSGIHKESFDNIIPILTKDILPHAIGLNKDVMAVMGQMNVLIGECIKISNAYHEMSVMKRPGYTPLKRFADTIEKLPGALDSVIYTHRSIFQYLNVLTARNK